MFANKSRHLRRLVLPVIASLPLFLAGCYEDDYGTYSGTGTGGVGGGTTAPLQSTIHNTSCSSQCTNLQTASQCAAADVRYSSYYQNWQAGADTATLTQLYEQYVAQAELANEFLNSFGCY